MFVLEAVVLTCLTTPLVSVLYPPHARKRTSAGVPPGAPGGDVESPRLSGKKASQDNQMKRFTVVLDKLEHLPSVMAITQLIRATPTVRTIVENSDGITKVTSRPSVFTNGSTETLSGSSPVVVEALRLIELSDRASALMKSSVTEYVIHTDPVLSIFRKFGQLNDVTVTPALSIVPFDDMPYTVAEHASAYDSDLIMIPWLPPQIASPDDFLDAVQNQQQPPSPQPQTAKHNPFDLLFKTTHSNSVEKSASVVHSHFVRGVFMKAKTDVALYVDQSPPGVDIATGSRHHVFLPFFGGPDDRLALDFVVQICDNPMTTATIVRITKKEGAVGDQPKLGEIEAGNMMTVTSVTLQPRLSIAEDPDVVYCRHYLPPSPTRYMDSITLQVDCSLTRPIMWRGLGTSSRRKTRLWIRPRRFHELSLRRYIRLPLCTLRWMKPPSLVAWSLKVEPIRMPESGCRSTRRATENARRRTAVVCWWLLDVRGGWQSRTTARSSKT